MRWPAAISLTNTTVITVALYGRGTGIDFVMLKDELAPVPANLVVYFSF